MDAFMWCITCAPISQKLSDFGWHTYQVTVSGRLGWITPPTLINTFSEIHAHTYSFFSCNKQITSYWSELKLVTSWWSHFALLTCPTVYEKCSLETIITLFWKWDVCLLRDSRSTTEKQWHIRKFNVQLYYFKRKKLSLSLSQRSSGVFGEMCRLKLDVSAAVAAVLAFSRGVLPEATAMLEKQQPKSHLTAF